MLRKGKEMTISVSSCLSQLLSSPVLAVTVVLTLGVILVNGWTDAPNAIATCVSTRAIGPKAAILMAAFFNFLGVFVMTMFNASVASTSIIWWILAETRIRPSPPCAPLG